MMRMRTKTTELTSIKEDSTLKEGDENKWEVRPGGMLVQKRNPDEPENRIPPPTIRVRVKYRSIYHEIIINSQATFGELKKMLTGPTGLHHEDQKLIYKDKERSSKMYLDVVGVKDKSKMVLIEDTISQEKRILEARKTAKIEKAKKSISDISLEVDRLSGQVSALELVISKGGKVEEKMVSNLIELLMNQLLKLDEINVTGEVNSQKKKQVERVQRYVETLDVLKLKAAKTRPSQARDRQRVKSRLLVEGSSPTVVAARPQEPLLLPPVSSSKKTSGAVVVTTQWETFDSLPTDFPAPPSTSTTGDTIQPKFNWDLI